MITIMRGEETIIDIWEITGRTTYIRWSINPKMIKFASSSWSKNTNKYAIAVIILEKKECNGEGFY